MLLSAFTIIRNGEQFDFPFLESIQSALEICDEFIINVGVSTDDTLKILNDFKDKLPEKLQRKIILFQSHWPLDDAEKRKGGQILAEQTNLALSKCKGTWCLYLQADEVLHENELQPILNFLGSIKENKDIEAVVFQYLHFYGNYQVIQTSRSSYRREVRIIRNNLGIKSTGDAQGFRHQNGQKLNAVLSAFHIFHYGWVRRQEKMKEKTVFMDSLYHQPDATPLEPATGNNYLYKRIFGLKPFKATHPKWMLHRIQAAIPFDFSTAPRVFHFNDLWKVISSWIEATTGYRPFEYKNYRLIK